MLTPTSFQGFARGGIDDCATDFVWDGLTALPWRAHLVASLARDAGESGDAVFSVGSQVAAYKDGDVVAYMMMCGASVMAAAPRAWPPVCSDTYSAFVRTMSHFHALHCRYMHKLRCWLDHTTTCVWPCCCCAHQLQQLYNLLHSLHSVVDCSAACAAGDERAIVGHFSELVSMTCQLLVSKQVLASQQTVHALLVLMTALADAGYVLCACVQDGVLCMCVWYVCC